MIRVRPFFSILILSLCAFFFNTAYADDWVKVESDHFIFYSDADGKTVKNYVERIERLNYLLGAFYNNNGGELENEKTSIYFVKSQLDLSVIEPNIKEYVGGFLRPCHNNVSIFSLYAGDKFLKDDDLIHQGDNPSRDLVFHEYSHIFMFNNVGLKYPVWFVEGFAEYYGATRINEKKSTYWDGTSRQFL